MIECVRCALEALGMAKVYWGEYLRHSGDRAKIDLMNAISELKHAETHIIEADRRIHDEIRALRMRAMRCLEGHECPDLPREVDRIILDLLNLEKGCEACTISFAIRKKPAHERAAVRGTGEAYIIPRGHNHLGEGKVVTLIRGYEYETDVITGAIVADIADIGLSYVSGYIPVTLPFNISVHSVVKLVAGGIIAYLINKGIIPTYTFLKAAAALLIYSGLKDIFMAIASGLGGGGTQAPPPSQSAPQMATARPISFM